ncbi:hypothetical protein PF005_g11982 [Phytophthora fragariae]|uniref:Uncharacterized protein n=1 Tax=Phytophthora fragariae TaxID=53985 RepID=A0A6A3S4E4_9STRA|nr:hypothetical protein PF009_g29053 [Phytophthora fragariae]KAE9109463.1 hypothetical protein PF007_g12225 [Phytophthora fragariae]KAE9208992.1 hypothetical protein PF005_g11982 [Phytophthora fragariae]KAE9228344.1 hypothetical protein PF002_g13561 [Phytophthora fragariae]
MQISARTSQATPTRVTMCGWSIVAMIFTSVSRASTWSILLRVSGSNIFTATCPSWYVPKNTSV